MSSSLVTIVPFKFILPPLSINFFSNSGLTKSSKKDRDLATKQLGDKGITWDLGSYTWHHIEGTNKLVLVDWYYHALCKHAGGRAISKI